MFLSWAGGQMGAECSAPHRGMTGQTGGWRMEFLSFSEGIIFTHDNKIIKYM